MKHYDFIFAGGGVAGLSLAYHLIHSPLSDRSMLIVDQDAKTRNDRTLCFWSDQPTLFDQVACNSWNRLQFVSDDFESILDLAAYRYKMIRGIDFYRFVRQALAARPNVEIVHGKVERIDDGDAVATVTVGAETVTGTWVFDSLFRLSGFAPDPARCYALQQHFKGWEIETPDAVFDTRSARLFDFRTPQKGEMRFFYLLPISERRALVEYVLLSRDHNDEAIKSYVENVLGIKTYRVVAEEGGVSPLTDYPFARRRGRHILAIGIQGGRIKPSSGYAFVRIQNNSAAIVRSLAQTGQPFDIPPDSRLYRLCDTIMLHLMVHSGERMKPIFAAMFKKNPVQRIFRFLDETASPLEFLALIASMPRWLFLMALFRVVVLRKIRRANSPGTIYPV